MKYIDAEKLITEIEKWRNKAKEKYFESTYSMGRCDAFAEFRNYIVSLQQEQTDFPSGEDVMIMCNQILIDWVKEGKTHAEKEQREQAHIRFYELYDEYLFQEQPEVDLDKEIEKFVSVKGLRTRVYIVKAVAHYFYELGLNARKEE